jgi:hypothetical protein
MTTQPYACRPAGQRLFSSDRAKIKIYFVDIYGRTSPECYEWAKSSFNQDILNQLLQNKTITGIGFAVSFPHITKVFCFDSTVETNLNVRAFSTSSFNDIDLNRDESFQEFACLAEVLIARDEFMFWAQAHAVEAYLNKWSDWKPVEILNPNKLLDSSQESLQ